MRSRIYSLLHLGIISLMPACTESSLERPGEPGVMDPYDDVDWTTYTHYRADLHVHTIQSDGCHLPDEVIAVYRDAGFSILSITDHDTLSPNGCPLREEAAPVQLEKGIFTDRHSPYPAPRPPNFPANTTWPWTDFGAPGPEELGMIGIEGSELTCGHHRSAYFVDYGALEPCADAPSINEQLSEVGRLGGLLVLNHPEPRFKEWYYELFRNHPADYLLGMEISPNVADSTAVWDQLLGDLMPSRPIWGFAASDMHVFPATRFAFTVFLLEEPTSENVRMAMQAGQFYSVTGPGLLDPRETRQAAYDGSYPDLLSVSIDRETPSISIDAENYDEIVWITGSPTWRYTVDADTGISWPSGEVLHRGPVFDYTSIDPGLSYVRAEVIRQSESGPIRLLLNPFALTRP